MGAAEQARAELRDGRRAEAESKKGLGMLFIEWLTVGRRDVYMTNPLTALAVAYYFGGWDFQSLGNIDTGGIQGVIDSVF